MVEGHALELLRGMVRTKGGSDSTARICLRLWRGVWAHLCALRRWRRTGSMQRDTRIPGVSRLRLCLCFAGWRSVLVEDGSREHNVPIRSNAGRNNSHHRQIPHLILPILFFAIPIFASFLHVRRQPTLSTQHRPITYLSTSWSSSSNSAFW